MNKLISLILLVFISLAHGQEIMMVWAKKVDLYNEQGKIERILRSGDIVQVENFEKDNTRFLIELDGQKYNAKKVFFKSPAEIVTIYKKKILEYEAEIKKNDLRISNIDSDLTVRYVQALELRRDTALAYQKLTPLTSGSGVVYTRGYSIMLSVGKYKKLMKEWSKEVAEITEEKQNLQSLKSKYSITIEQLKYEISSFENLNDKMVNKKQVGDQYFVVQDGAQLYLNNKVVKHLKKGVSVLGRPHPQFSDWFEVIVDNKKYTISGKSVVKKDEYSKYLNEKIITSKVMVSQLSDEVENQQFRLKLYQGVSRQLETNKFVNGGYGLAKNLIVPIDKERNFTIRSPNADEVYVNSIIADKVLREWKSEALSLEQASLMNQKKVLELKKEMIDLQNTLNNLKN